MLKIIIILLIMVPGLFAQNNYRYAQFSRSEYKYSLSLPDDSLKNIVPLGKVKKHSTINLSLQVIVGEGLGIVLAIIPLSISFGSAWNGSNSKVVSDVFGALSIPTYIIGVAAGVHWIARVENPKHSFWKTVGYSAIGGAAGVVLAAILASKYETIPPAGAVTLLFPLISSIIYSTSIADWPYDNNINYNERFSPKKNFYSHKDLIESSKLFNISLVTINF